MASTNKSKPIWKKIGMGILISLVIVGIAFHLFITRYLPPLVRNKLAAIIVNGSDSLYTFEVGKFNLSFWGGAVDFADLRIRIDSTVYKRMKEEKRLPPLTSQLFLKEGHINGIGLRALIFSKKIDVREIVFDAADLQLARHFTTSKERTADNRPLWKLIQPRIRSIRIGNIYAAGIKISYRNIDSAAAFNWQINKSNLLLSDVRVDSVSTNDSSRLLFAKNISFNTRDVKLDTRDGLYGLRAEALAYTSANQAMEVKGFQFVPVVNDQQFKKQFGYQHEIYKIKTPLVRVSDFPLQQWITENRLQAGMVELSSPVIAIDMDRRARPNTQSKLGKYPQQLLQRAPFSMLVKSLKASNASVIYTETSDVTNMTGKLVFHSLRGTINNITNDPVALQRSAECIADIRGSIMNTGNLQAVFRFNLKDRSGAFHLKAAVTTLDAGQLKPLFKAMTAVDMQSFDLHRLDFTMNGNEHSGNGNLSLEYGNMDILINQVEADKSFDKKGLLSFLANRLLIYKENPQKNEEVRKAYNIIVQRDPARSFFYLVWKTLFTSAGEIVLRPLAKRKIEKKQARAERRTQRQERREERRNQRKN